MNDTVLKDKTVFWHRELPPLSAVPLGMHVVEANSHRLSGVLERSDESWDVSHRDLMAHASVRFEQELARLGGDYAHVLSESIDPMHDPNTDEGWLHGRFTYMLYGRPDRCGVRTA